MNKLPIELCEEIALYAHPIHPCKNEIDGNPYAELLFGVLQPSLRLFYIRDLAWYNPGYSNAHEIEMDVNGFYDFYELWGGELSSDNDE